MNQLLRPPAAEPRWGRAQHLWEHTLLGPAAVAAAAGGTIGLLQAVDPTEPGHYPTCPVLFLTGWFCPGCGSLRMLHHLGDGNVAEAWAMNPLGLVMVLALVLYWVGWTRRVVTGRARSAPLPAWAVWAFFVVVVGYAVLRNLPGMGVLAPG